MERMTSKKDASVMNVICALNDAISSGIYSGKALSQLECSRNAARTIRGLNLPLLKKSTEDRIVKWNYRKVFAPMVWHTKLPTNKRFVSDRFYCVETDEWIRVKTAVPLPPKKAVELYKTYKDHFDACEMWWVPSDLQFEVEPDPDPIIVGVLKVNGKKLYTEIYRWIDETVEDPIYSAIAY